MGPGEGTWTCHVCGEERPDRFISVQAQPDRGLVLCQHNFAELVPGVPVQQNVRYCNDRPACKAAAPSVSFIADRKEPE